MGMALQTDPTVEHQVQRGQATLQRVPVLQASEEPLPAAGPQPQPAAMLAVALDLLGIVAGVALLMRKLVRQVHGPQQWHRAKSKLA